MLTTSTRPQTGWNQKVETEIPIHHLIVTPLTNQKKVHDQPSYPLTLSLVSCIQKTKIMISSPITSWQIEGEKVETVTDFIFLGSQITVDGDCSHEIKRCLLLGRKAMTNLDSVLRSRDKTLPTKIHVVKAMVFPVVMYRYESYTIEKLSARELMLLNCGVGEGSLESLGLKGDPASPS